MYVIHYNYIFRYGLSFGSALAIAISFATNKSVLWAIIHGILSWFYVLYYIFFVKKV